jgi:3-dehydroquinate synthetase
MTGNAQDGAVLVDVDTGSLQLKTWSVRDVALGATRYPYHLSFDCVDRIAWQIGQNGVDRFLVVTDDTVLNLHGDVLLPELAKYAPAEALSFPPGEEIKTLQTLTQFLERSVSAGASRRSVVIAFGGGVPGNLGGLLAGLLFRGIRLVHVPTTTVAAMDSTISLKQAVNSSHGKNHFGMYHPPQAVFADVRFLQTLPVREIRSGLCETTKNCLAIRPTAIPALRAVISSAWDSAEALLWVLEESLTAKSQVTVGDAREQASGLVLEYGHTVGHAIEVCQQHRRDAVGISHGEAVAIGMRAAARISASMGGLDSAGVAVHDELIEALGVPAGIPPGLDVNDIMTAVRADNKRGYLELAEDQAAMVLLRTLGTAQGTKNRPLVAVDLSLVEDVVTGLA